MAALDELASHAPAVHPALAERGPVGGVLLDDLLEGGLGVDGVRVELFLAVRVVADLAVVALARFLEVFAQPSRGSFIEFCKFGT